MRESTPRHMRTAKPQISQRGTGPLLSVCRNIGFFRMNRQTTVPIRLCVCAGCSDPLLFAYDIRAIFLTYVTVLLLFIMKTRLFKYIENFTTKKWKRDSFHILAQNIDCWYWLETPRWGGSNEYPQFMFLSRDKKIIVYACKLQFYCVKVEFKGSKL